MDGKAFKEFTCLANRACAGHPLNRLTTHANSGGAHEKDARAAAGFTWRSSIAP